MLKEGKRLDEADDKDFIRGSNDDVTRRLQNSEVHGVRECLVCGKSFAKKFARKFCGRDCYLANRRRINNSRYKEKRSVYQKQWHKEKGIEYHARRRKTHKMSINSRQRKQRMADQLNVDIIDVDAEILKLSGQTVNWTESQRKTAIRLGYRSGLEHQIALELKQLGKPFLYEVKKLKYISPAKVHTYTPDIWLPNGIHIELKGYMEASARKKYKLVIEQNPDVDLRFVFSNASLPINKGSATTYGMWADSLGIIWAEKRIPEAWFLEEGRG